MFTANKMKFCKNEDCPSSEELVDFQNGDIELDRGSAICAHLAVCEFCSSEVEFYSRYPQSYEETSSEVTAIPAPLFQLAEAILNNRHADLRELNTLLRENEELLAEKV